VIQSNLRRIWDVSKTLIEESGKTPKYWEAKIEG
jgi:hypothetical protein